MLKQANKNKKLDNSLNRAQSYDSPSHQSSPMNKKQRNSNNGLNLKLSSTQDAAASTNQLLINNLNSVSSSQNFGKNNLNANSLQNSQQYVGVHIQYQNNNHLGVNPYQRVAPLQSSIQQIIMEEDTFSPINRGVNTYQINSDQKAKNIAKIANFYTQNPNEKLHNPILQSSQNQLIRKNNFTASPNQSIQEDPNHQQMPMLTQQHQLSQRQVQSTTTPMSIHNRKKSNTNFQNLANLNIMNIASEGSKQLPPLDPKSSQTGNNLQTVSQSRQGKRPRVNANIGRLDSHESSSHMDLISPPKGQKFIVKHKKDNQGFRNTSNQQSVKKISNTNLSSFVESTQIQSHGANIMLTGALSIDRHLSQHNMDSFKSQKSITKQNLNNILNEQHAQSIKHISSQSKKAMHQNRQSPYSINQTAELLQINEKRQGSQQNNARQKKLRSVIQSYQSPTNKNNQQQTYLAQQHQAVNRFDVNNSPININENQSINPQIIALSGYATGDNLSKRFLQQQIQTYSPSSLNQFYKPQSMMSHHIQDGIVKHRSDSLGKVSSNQQIQSSASKFLNNKKVSKQKKHDALKLNLSHIERGASQNNESQNAAHYENGMLTAKSNFQNQQMQMQNVKAVTTKNGKKLQINLKKISGLNSLKISSSKNQGSNISPFITTDDRRLFKHENIAMLQNQSHDNSNLEFTSARLILSKKIDQLSIGRKQDSADLYQATNTKVADTRFSRNIKSHHTSQTQSDMIGIISVRENQNQIDSSENMAFPTVIIDTHEAPLVTGSSINNQIDKVLFSDFLRRFQSLQRTSMSQEQIESQIQWLGEFTLQNSFINLSQLITSIQQLYKDHIQGVQKAASQNQSVSPSAYQIIKEDNQRQVQLILNLQSKTETQESDIDTYKSKILELEQKLQQNNSSQNFPNKDEQNLKNSEESIKRVTKELGQMYEQNQEQQKEIKKLKKELKESQSREKDYLSVLKNTSEFSKIAIEQQTKAHNQSQLQQQQTALQMSSIITQNAAITQQIVSQLSPQLKLEGFNAFTFNQNPSSNRLTSKTQNEINQIQVPKLNLKLAMKNQHNHEIGSSERLGKDLSEQSRNKAIKKYESAPLNPTIPQQTDGQDINQTNVKLFEKSPLKFKDPKFTFEQQQSEKIVDINEGENEVQLNLNSIQHRKDKKGSQQSQPQQQSSRTKSSHNLKNSSCKNLRSNKEDEDEENERRDEIKELNNKKEDNQLKNNQKSIVPPLLMKKLTTNIEQLNQPKMGGLDFKKLNKIQDFQDEFMGKYEEFSLSWREAIRRDKRF
eukprot:403361058